ncbi:MAG: Deoxyuridine 5'-triphosphate nucleotidohydrolase [uncultured bacterium]|nr:MAG: Deoxyuridine 5'-triphosphate nucleotidohydrolase [uncultured bacterium]
MEIQLKRLHPNAILPVYAHDTDAGMDLYAATTMVVAPSGRVLVPTGVAMAIPEGYVGLVWDKSGVVTKTGLTTLAGVIDAGYRGEIKIALYNSDTQTQTVTAGQKIAQLLIQPIVQGTLIEVNELSATVRGAGGFGSTGLK